jgi:spore coat polysaccharide biosynthesis predicted glycosyltransferase SpsG
VRGIRILFRADASHDIGFGHVARATALIEEVAALGGEPIAMFGGDAPSIASWTRDRGLTVDAQDRPANQVAAFAEEQRVHAVVIDGRRVADHLVPELVERGIRSVLIDDTGGCTLPVTAIVNHNFHAPTLATTYPAAGRRLLGRRYLMLRNEIRRFGHGSCRPTVASRLRIVITFGGSDPVNATARVVRLLPDDRELELVVICGPGFRDEDGLRQAIAVATDRGHTIDIRRSPADPGELFVGADAAICSAGGTLGELAYLGCPALAYAIASDQVAPARMQVRDGLIAGGRTWTDLDDDTIQSDLHAFLFDDAGRTRQRMRALATADSDGAHRVVDEALG